MKDIDFDELDRAVSSLLGKPGGSDLPAAPTQQESVPSPASAPSIQNKPVASAPQEQKVTPSTTPQAPQPRPVAPAPQVAPRFTPGRSSTPSVQSRRSDTKFPITPSTSQDFNTPEPQQPSVSQNVASNVVSEPPVKTQTLAQASNTLPSTQPNPETVQKPSQAPQKPPQKPQISRPVRNGGSRFMDVVHPATQQPNAATKPVQALSKKPMASPQSQPVKPATTPTQGSIPAQQASPQPQVVKRTGVMGASSMPSRVSHAGRTIESPKSPKPSSFVDSLIPKLRQATRKDDTVSSSPTLLKAPVESKKLDEGRHEELLTAQAGKPAGEQQRRVAEEIPSPFLTNTKVEKRPLGGGSVPSGASHSEASTVKQTLDAEATRLDQQAEDRSFYDEKQGSEEYSAITDGYYEDELGSTPTEFDQDVVAAEAIEPDVPEEERPDTPPAYPPERKTTPITTVKQASKAAETATMSIPQQYRAKTATPDKTPRSIYDTEEYHKPLPAAASRKSKSHPVVWILLIVLLLAIGAGLGVAAYFLVG